MSLSGPVLEAIRAFPFAVCPFLLPFHHPVDVESLWRSQIFLCGAPNFLRYALHGEFDRKAPASATSVWPTPMRLFWSFQSSLQQHVLCWLNLELLNLTWPFTSTSIDCCNLCRADSITFVVEDRLQRWLSNFSFTSEFLQCSWRSQITHLRRA